jgi:oxygen-independent coproporphyrinogen-3 oxidase
MVLSAIVKEIVARKHELDQPLFHTVYLGGGTPSLLTEEELEGLLSAVRTNYPIAADAELTLEANPDDLNPASLQIWRKLGINRLSIGVQSFFDRDLQWMNRAHNASEALDGIQQAKEAGFENFSIDLIYGTPGLTDEDWISNIERAIGLGVPHLSCYALTVEEKTALAHLIKHNKLPNTDPEQQSRQFLILMERVRRAGYEHYEISNFALPGWRSRHNSSYWSGEPYLGFGPGAHSYNGSHRRWNVSNNSVYLRAVNAGEPYSEQEELTTENRRHEYIMTSLRTMEGLDLNYYRISFGEKATNDLLNLATKYLQLTKSEGPARLTITADRIMLTDEGKLFADGIAAHFF